MRDLGKYCVNKRSSIKDAVFAIQSNASRCVVVLNEHDCVVGVFAEGDVLRAVLSDLDLNTPLEKVVKPSMHYLVQRDMQKASELVARLGITLVPVLNADFRLTDVITLADIIDYLRCGNNKRA